MRLGSLIVLGSVGLALAAPVAMAEQTGDVVAALTGNEAETASQDLLPAGLPAADLARYRALFALQHEGRWAEAEALMGTLADELLLGHVLAERYLAKAAPRAGFAELSGWLDSYADLPQAGRIHKLALARKPAGSPRPRAPEPLPGGGDRLWDDGLEAWRAADYPRAADRLTHLAGDAHLDDPERARAAFWAARANLRAHRPRLVVPMLQVAARTADAFYGPLAQRMLEDVVDYGPAEAREEIGLTSLMIRYPAARRALALAAIDERELAAAELQRLSARAPSDLLPDLGALARGLDLPGGAPERTSAARSVRADRLELPPAEWEPAGGYRLDRHLLHAVIRAESGFDPLARSSKGALGLMQVMPDTAQHVARLTQIAYAGEDWLLEPANNLAVGQAWLRELAGSPTVGGSLIHLLVAYNAGEGRLRGWLADQLEPADDDPLLFIESLPIRETRAYVKKVLGNQWAYQDRERETSPSLRALAENRWPEIDPAPRPEPKAVSHAWAD